VLESLGVICYHKDTFKTVLERRGGRLGSIT